MGASDTSPGVIDEINVHLFAVLPGLLAVKVAYGTLCHGCRYHGSGYQEYRPKCYLCQSFVSMQLYVVMAGRYMLMPF